MLRAVDDVDGQGIYIRKLCEALFALDSQNQYVAYYWRARPGGPILPTTGTCGRSSSPGATSCSGTRCWCRWPPAATRLDVLFHHKYSIPLLAALPHGRAAAGHGVLGPSGVLHRLVGAGGPGVRPGHDPALLPPRRPGAHQLRHPGRGAGAVRRRPPSQAAHGVRLGGPRASGRSLIRPRSPRCGRGTGSRGALPPDGGEGPSDHGSGLRQDAHSAQERGARDPGLRADAGARPRGRPRHHRLS